MDIRVFDTDRCDSPSLSGEMGIIEDEYFGSTLDCPASAGNASQYTIKRNDKTYIPYIVDVNEEMEKAASEIYCIAPPVSDPSLRENYNTTFKQIPEALYHAKGLIALELPQLGLVGTVSERLGLLTNLRYMKWIGCMALVSDVLTCLILFIADGWILKETS